MLPSFARLLLLLLLITLFGCGSVASEGEATSEAASTSNDVVTTDRGPVRGRLVDGMLSFRGLPFATPPTGALRWKAPTPPAPWSEIRDATEFASKCLQRSLGGTVEGSEDCLYLNVWTKRASVGAADARPKAVMFFIHGGANVIGASNEQVEGKNLYDGLSLAHDRDVVVVTVNYRLGAFGFFAHPALASGGADEASGNFALLDQIAALAWVKRNIRAFGGDPERVMVFGESAGALSTCVLLASPRARGLFASALMESGECSALSRDEAERRARIVGDGVGCAGDDVAACLRAKPAADLAFVPTSHTPNALRGWDLYYASNVDGVVLDRAPLESLRAGQPGDVPLVVGSNAHETELFLAKDSVTTCDDVASYVAKTLPTVHDEVARQYPCAAYPFPRWAAVAVTTDLFFTCPARRIARAASSSGRLTRRYFYTHVRDYGELSFLRAFHMAELAFVFRTYGLRDYVPTPGEVALSTQVQGYWSNLAKAGNPNDAFLLAWPRYRADSDPLVVLDEVPSVALDPSRSRCDFWDTFVGP